MAQEGAIPREALAQIRRATDELTASKLADQAPVVGETAPDFTLPNANGKPVSLDEALARGPVVVVFYRGTWCPFCNTQLRALQQNLPEITKLVHLLKAM